MSSWHDDAFRVSAFRVRLFGSVLANKHSAFSGCGFAIDEAALPLTPGCTPARALGDGEDFEILLTIEAGRVAALLTAMPLLLA